MTIESTEVHEPSDADIDDMRIHMTLHDLRGLVDMNLSIQDVNIIISALEPIHMALTSKITVSGNAQDREETEDWFLAEKSYEEYYND